MDAITKELAELILETDITERPDLKQQSLRALADYLGAAWAGSKEDAPQRMAHFLKGRKGDTPVLGFSLRTTPEEAALSNGFISHYLDFDDAQANLMGHGSTVLFSTLLALAGPETEWNDFLSAYVAGSEIEGVLGAVINPEHKHQGWHPTATLGPIAGTAAIARLKKLSLEETAELLSLGATQSGGLGLEAGTDTKPLHAGLAAGNSVRAYFFLKSCGVTSSDSVFNANDGWMKTISGKSMKPGYAKAHWLLPGQILVPGLWMKEHQYCSAAIPGAAAVKALVEEGLRIDDVKQMTFHFPPGKSYSLHYARPLTGKQGRFSMEFVAWQILKYGDVQDVLFKEAKVPDDFLAMQPRLTKVEDLPVASQEARRIVVTIETLGGRYLTKEIQHPAGSPSHPFSWDELQRKISIGTNAFFARQVIQSLQARNLSWDDFQTLIFSWKSMIGHPYPEIGTEAWWCSAPCM